MTEARAAARPVPGRGVGQRKPVKRSVVHRKHAAIGASFVERGGWLVPDGYGSVDEEIAALSTSLGFADVSARGKVHLSGAIDDQVRSLTGAALNPLNTAPTARGGAVARIARDCALVLLGPSAEGDVMLALEQQQTDRAMATDVTGALSGFLVAGPRVEELLVRTVTIDPARLLPGSCAAASWARVPATLVMKDLQAPAVEIYVSSDYGRYAWEVLQRLAGMAVGWRALESWGWT